MFTTYTLGEFCRSCISNLSSSSMPKEVCVGMARGAFYNLEQHIIKNGCGSFGDHGQVRHAGAVTD